MANKNEQQMAEIVNEDSELDEVSFWPDNKLDDISVGEKKNSEVINYLNRYLNPGQINGLREILESKNQGDPGHEHLFPPRKKTVIQSFFESKDGWATGGVGTEVITPQIGGVSITTGTSANDDAWMLATTTGFNSFDVSQASVFQSILKVSAATTILSYWGVGDITAGGGFGGANEAGYGFKYVSGTLSSLTVVGGVETLKTISGITATNFNEYRAIFDGKSVSFFVNGRNVNVHRAGLPTADDDIFATYYVKATAISAARTLYAKYMYFVQINT